MCALSYRDIHLIRLFSVIVLRSKTNTLFYYVQLVINTKIYLSHKLQINFAVFFVTQLFAEDKCIQELSIDSITDTKQALKDGPLSRAVMEIVILIYIIWHQISLEIYCYKQPVLDIALDLNVTYSVLKLLISFQEYPW